MLKIPTCLSCTCIEACPVDIGEVDRKHISPADLFCGSEPPAIVFLK